MTATATRAFVEVDDLDPVGVLEAVADAETLERRAGMSKLQLAVAWCHLHPATRDSGESGAAVWGDSGLPGLSEWDETLGGEGCPQVAADAPEPFAASLGVSTMAGMQLLADGLDLAYRLPHTWAKVQALQVAPWRARRLAQATHRLTRQAAGYVDTQLADRVDSCGAVLIDRTVAQAAARFDPSPVVVAEEEAKQSWNVRLFHRTDGAFAGTSHLEATGDTLSLTKLYDLVCDHAAHLARHGDPDPLGARKAKALGVIADTQSQLDLDGTQSREGESEETVRVRRPSLAKTRLYLHLHLHPHSSDLTADTWRAGEVERLGPATLATIKQWLGSSRATIVPVLDLGRDDPVDTHDPPQWMRETVVLRDRHCVFPWCRIDARVCDLDHITPYLPIDQGGPPGQTAPSKLAPLCRRHHNAKTTGRWHYQRHRDGTYTWHGPHHTSYLVTPLGTTTLPPA
jgi:hypothetical protein